MKKKEVEKEERESLIIEIPLNKPVPSMITDDKYKTPMFKWLDDKPCLYGCFGFDNNYTLYINGMTYVIREWLEKFYIPLTETDLTVDELIELFDHDRITKEFNENLEKHLG
jgi:hypothetical protein